MKNLHLLPTGKPSPLMIEDGKLFYSKNFGFNEFNETKNFRHINKQHIYITSDDELKDGDWCILLENYYLNGGIGKYNSKKAIGYGLHHTTFFQKIILTTDQDLIKDGVQAINDEFLEWFIKNPSCEFVDVKLNSFGECHGDDCSCFDDGDQKVCIFYYPDYKIIITQEEPKTVFELEKYMELASELAHERTLYESGDICNNEDDMYEDINAETTVYKDEIQERFSNWYDYYLNKLRSFKNKAV